MIDILISKIGWLNVLRIENMHIKLGDGTTKKIKKFQSEVFLGQCVDGKNLFKATVLCEDGKRYGVFGSAHPLEPVKEWNIKAPKY